MALYDLLKGANVRHAVLMVILFAVSVPIAFLNELSAIAALVFVRGADFPIGVAVAALICGPSGELAGRGDSGASTKTSQT